MRSKKLIKILILSLLPFAQINAFASDNNIGMKYCDNSTIDYDTYLISPDSLKTNDDYDSNKVIDKNINLLWNNSEWLKFNAHDSSKNIGNPNNFLPHGNIKIERIEFAQIDRNNGFFKSTTFKLMLGSAVLLGGTAAYFKIQGDKKYESYLMNKDNHTLTEVDRYDLYSGIAFGLLQINFGYLLYKFIIE